MNHMTNITIVWCVCPAMVRISAANNPACQGLSDTGQCKKHTTRQSFTCLTFDAEIKVPKEVREFMPSWAEPTMLGDPRGAARQYRYGNLHIREYAGHYTIHADRADPRRDPLGHLIYDAPEVLAGLAGGAAAGALVYIGHRHAGKGRAASAASAVATALEAGLLAYEGSKQIKERARRAGQRQQRQRRTVRR